MDKIEKVIQAFENCMAPEMNDDETCVDCIRAGECPWEDCQERDCKLIDIPLSLAIAALELLKDQEPKKVKCVRRLTKVMKGVCPACEMEIESVIHGRLTKFCKFCSQAVKWEEADLRERMEKAGG